MIRKWRDDIINSTTIFLKKRFPLKKKKRISGSMYKTPPASPKNYLVSLCLDPIRYMPLKRLTKLAVKVEAPKVKLRSTTRPVATGLGFFNCLVIAISGQMGWFTPRYHSYIWLVCIHISHINLSLSKRESLNHSIVRGDTRMNNNILHYVGETSGCIKTKKLTEITGIGKVSS